MTQTEQSNNLDPSLFPFSTEESINDLLIDIPRSNCYIEKFKSIKSENPSDLIMVHLNICSIKTKIQFADELLNLNEIDILFISETFLDEDTPTSFYKNINYQTPLRRDRHKHGSGLLIFIRKGYHVKEIDKSTNQSPSQWASTTKNTISSQAINHRMKRMRHSFAI